MDIAKIARQMFLLYSLMNPVQLKEHGFRLEWRMTTQTFIELVKEYRLVDYGLNMSNQFLGIEITLTGQMDDGEVNLITKVVG